MYEHEDDQYTYRDLDEQSDDAYDAWRDESE